MRSRIARIVIAAMADVLIILSFEFREITIPAIDTIAVATVIVCINTSILTLYNQASTPWYFLFFSSSAATVTFKGDQYRLKL